MKLSDKETQITHTSESNNLKTSSKKDKGKIRNYCTKIVTFSWEYVVEIKESFYYSKKS